MLTCSPDLAGWLRRTGSVTPHEPEPLAGIEAAIDSHALLANLPSDIIHQALPLADGTTAHTLTRTSDTTIAALHRDVAMLRETLDAVEGQIVVYDSNLIYVFGNAAYHSFYPHLPPEAELVGKPYEHVLGLSIAAGATVDPLHRADPQDFIAERRAAILVRTQATRETHNARMNRWSTVRTNWPPHGNRVSLRVDITALKRLQQQLLDTQRTRTIGHISGGVAHNFNNLLTVIISNIEMLLDEPSLTEKTTRLARRTLSSAEAGARLVRQLLSFSQPDATPTRTIDPNQILADMADMLHGAAGPTIPIEIVPDPQAGGVRADPAQLTIAMMNLVLNARDAVKEGLKAGTTRHGRIRITTAPAKWTEAGVSIRVSDNGIGMSPDVVAAAFDPFFTTKGLATSSGLGLSQVHSFAVGTGGDVRIQSVPGAGTSVEILLPASLPA